jgi:hypothetical protein
MDVKDSTGDPKRRVRKLRILQPAAVVPGSRCIKTAEEDHSVLASALRTTHYALHYALHCSVWSNFPQPCRTCICLLSVSAVRAKSVLAQKYIGGVRKLFP